MLGLAIFGIIVGTLYSFGGIICAVGSFDTSGCSRISYFFLIMGVTGLVIFISSNIDCKDIVDNDNDAVFPFAWLGFIAVPWLYLLIAWLFPARKARLRKYSKLIPYSEDRAMLLLSTPYWSNQVMAFRKYIAERDSHIELYNHLRTDHKLPRLRRKTIRTKNIKITFRHSRTNVYAKHRLVLSIPDDWVNGRSFYHNPDHLSSWSIYLDILQTEIDRIENKVKQANEQIAYEQQLADNEKAEYIENIEALAQVCQMTEQ